MPFRAREVAVRVDRDRSGPVGLHPAPVARVEHGRRQREHVVEVRLEQVPDRHVLAVVDAARDLVAAFQPRVREPVPSLRGRRRHHQVAAQETDRVLRASLLPAGIGVAEPRLEAVVRAEQREQPRLGDGPVGPAVADPVALSNTSTRGTCRHGRTPCSDHGTRIPRSLPAARPRISCSSTGTRPPGNARSVPRRRPRPGPGRNRPARCPAPIPAH